MNNPFRKRASENIIGSDAFLPLVSPAPIEYILQNHTGEELKAKLVFLLGTPGSGKTTFGRLFELESLLTLHRMDQTPSFKHLAKVLNDLGYITEDGPSVLAARLPMDAEYREIWELPYEEVIKRNLFLLLVQSRCVLVWCNALSEQGFSEEDIEINTSRVSPGAVESIGGNDFVSLRDRAAKIEGLVYKIIHALIPKSLAEIGDVLATPYDPLSCLNSFTVFFDNAEMASVLKPMVIIDDGHELHNKQFSNLTDFLIRRDLKIARWVMTRYDIAISANEWIQEQSTDGHAGRQLGRDFTVLLTNQGDLSQKRSFRSAALDIASRYLQEMPVFKRANQTKLSAMLMDKARSISPSNIQKLKDRIASDVATLRITDERLAKLRNLVDDYSGAVDETEDIRLGMLRILIHRYAKRTPQQELFSEIIDAEPKRELSADAGVMAAAKLHLFHEYDRPFYYGADMLADSGSGNIEQFLRTADELVSVVESKLIRNKREVLLTAEEQHKLVTAVATTTIDDWDFPMHKQVLQLVDFIGKKAVDASLSPNAYLDHGANAYGVLRRDFEKMRSKFPELALVIHYAAAYNAISIHPSYHCKNETWTLFQLGGYPIIKHGLTFNKGGFVEGGMQSLFKAIEWNDR